MARSNDFRARREVARNRSRAALRIPRRVCQVRGGWWLFDASSDRIRAGGIWVAADVAEAVRGNSDDLLAADDRAGAERGCRRRDGIADGGARTKLDHTFSAAFPVAAMTVAGKTCWTVDANCRTPIATDPSVGPRLVSAATQAFFCGVSAGCWTWVQEALVEFAGLDKLTGVAVGSAAERDGLGLLRVGSQEALELAEELRLLPFAGEQLALERAQAAEWARLMLAGLDCGGSAPFQPPLAAGARPSRKIPGRFAFSYGCFGCSVVVALAGAAGPAASRRWASDLTVDVPGL